MLSAALEAGQGGTPVKKSCAYPVITTMEEGPRTSPKTARPNGAAAVGWMDEDTLKLSSGLALQKERDGKGSVVRQRDKPMTAYRMDAVMVAFHQVSESH